MINLKDKTVLVLGYTSMIGRAVVEVLEKRGAIVPQDWHVHYDGTYSYDLTKRVHTDALFSKYKPDYCVVACGKNGGLKFNIEHPAEIFHKTCLMALNVLNAANRYGVKKTVSLISSCAYPDMGEQVMSEEQLWEGICNHTVECHGLAKRMYDAYSRQLNKEFGNKFITVTLQNCYGEYDNFTTSGKVVSGLIQKFVAARRENLPFVECWGTGAPLREFVYAQDAGECIVQALENYDGWDSTLNITSEAEISIKELTELVKEASGYEGKVRWDTSKADGQMKKAISAEKMKKYIDHKFTSLREGLKQTVQWYESQL